jgi:hypothetical protein
MNLPRYFSWLLSTLLLALVGCSGPNVRVRAVEAVPVVSGQVVTASTSVQSPAERPPTQWSLGRCRRNT